MDINCSSAFNCDNEIDRRQARHQYISQDLRYDDDNDKGGTNVNARPLNEARAVELSVIFK